MVVFLISMAGHNAIIFTTIYLPSIFGETANFMKKKQIKIIFKWKSGGPNTTNPSFLESDPIQIPHRFY